MSTYIKVDGNPDDVTGTGARLKGQAESFKAQVQSVLGDIESIEADAPWGTDDPGQAFMKSYNQTPEGGGTPFSQSLKDELGNAGDQLSKAGDGIMLAMTQYQGTDTGNSSDIKNVKKV
ncbi:MAG TPA: hypothetical protein VJT31_15575 [Rugosimonospora sp.]|nr:hypothetical protein [Rugosimonospora sp.]